MGRFELLAWFRLWFLVSLLAGAIAVRAEDGGGLDRLLAEAAQHYQARRYFQAIDVFERALKLAGARRAQEVRAQLARALGALGTEYFNAGESRRAEESFLGALAHAGDYYAHLGLGYLYFFRLKDNEALTHLQAALKERPDHARTHLLLALIEYRQGQTASARRRLAEAGRLDPADAETQALLKRWNIEAAYSASFVEQPGRRFTLRVDPLLPAGAAEIARRELERAHEEVGAALGHWPARKIPVVLFSEKRFYEATGSHHWVGGMYDGQLKMPVAAELSRDEQLESLKEVIRHEYAHVLIREVAPECPVWLNEGIAQHFERPGRRAEVEALLYKDRSMRLPFQSVPAQLWAIADETQARWIYLQGLGFVEFLVERYQAFRLSLLLQAMARERSVARAFERVYGQPLEALEEAWWESILKRGG
jgi:tetratricopeptide (TPR) repeat protein